MLTKRDREVAQSLADNTFSHLIENYWEIMDDAPQGTDQKALWKLVCTSLQTTIENELNKTEKKWK